MPKTKNNAAPQHPLLKSNLKQLRLPTMLAEHQKLAGEAADANQDYLELLFQIFADRYERSSTLLTSNLPFSEWQQIFQGERMTAALLDRLTHHCEIFEMTGESYRFRESMKKKQASTKPASNQK